MSYWQTGVAYPHPMATGAGGYYGSPWQMRGGPGGHHGMHAAVTPRSVASPATRSAGKAKAKAASAGATPKGAPRRVNPDDVATVASGGGASSSPPPARTAAAAAPSSGASAAKGPSASQPRVLPVKSPSPPLGGGECWALSPSPVSPGRSVGSAVWSGEASAAPTPTRASASPLHDQREGCGGGGAEESGDRVASCATPESGASDRCEGTGEGGAQGGAEVCKTLNMGVAGSTIVERRGEEVCLGACESEETEPLSIHVAASKEQQGAEVTVDRGEGEEDRPLSIHAATSREQEAEEVSLGGGNGDETEPLSIHVVDATS
eukprot:CAMPEP_0172025814 /NCGR_PEP_ID=MMETSP1041-20130122/16099_1 /TAXON_ID=464988 /ORGANISM="Hemiselmis andersenii, Strain CCMP439" /LENGTH=320 /DNA_ID=CAMNT_0012681537 /DNA_START=111 /DNA_END=1070 /DNA_ORIENTATION=-